jgi:hypothetical protein
MIDPEFLTWLAARRRNNTKRALVFITLFAIIFGGALYIQGERLYTYATGAIWFALTFSLSRRLSNPDALIKVLQEQPYEIIRITREHDKKDDKIEFKLWKDKRTHFEIEVKPKKAPYVQQNLELGFPDIKIEEIDKAALLKIKLGL